MADGLVSVSLLFYGGFPLGFANREAEREALAFRAAGYDVRYAPGVGLRDPGWGSLPKALSLAAARARRPRAAPGAPVSALPALTLLVAPPRRAAPVRRANVAWVTRQLRAALPDWSSTVAWLRFPSPEVVAALARLGPAATVYESVDALHETPGLAGSPWLRPFLAAEDALVRRADAIVTTSEPLRDRFAARHGRVHCVPHGVELFPWQPRPRAQGAAPVLGFVGTLDFRIDTDVVLALARHRADWRIELRGPVGPGFEAGRLAGHPNVRVGGPVAPEDLGAVLSGFDVGLMPYRDIPHYRYGNAVKNLELMAAGRPAVARTTPALAVPDGVYLADGPQAFVAACEQALAEDDDDRARARRALAERHTAARRHERLLALLADLTGALAR